MTAAEQELPLAVELRPPPDVESALVAFAAQPHCLKRGETAPRQSAAAVPPVRFGRY